jgi:hypothetical protein
VQKPDVPAHAVGLKLAKSPSLTETHDVALTRKATPQSVPGSNGVMLAKSNPTSSTDVPAKQKPDLLLLDSLYTEHSTVQTKADELSKELQAISAWKSALEARIKFLEGR